jgi:hypothetical protein
MDIVKKLIFNEWAIEIIRIGREMFYAYKKVMAVCVSACRRS